MRTKFYAIVSCICLVMTVSLYSCGNKEKDSNEVDKMSSEVTEAIENDDFATAYKIVDPWFKRHDDVTTRDAAFQLNEKILKNEIANLVATDSNGDNGARIIFAIGERAKYNDYWSSVNDSYELGEKIKMLKYAIEISSLNDNKSLTDKLESALLKYDQSEAIFK